MGIEANYNKVVEVERLTDDESGDTQEYGVHLADVACMIQPLDDNFSEDIDGNFGKDYLMFSAPLDIKEGDRIIDGATEYRVVGFESFDLTDQAHMEVRIREFNP